MREFHVPSVTVIGGIVPEYNKEIWECQYMSYVSQL